MIILQLLVNSYVKLMTIDSLSVQLTIAGITYAGMYSPMPLGSKVCFLVWDV